MRSLSSRKPLVFIPVLNTKEKSIPRNTLSSLIIFSIVFSNKNVALAIASDDNRYAFIIRAWKASFYMALDVLEHGCGTAWTRRTKPKHFFNVRFNLTLRRRARKRQCIFSCGLMENIGYCVSGRWGFFRVIFSGMPLLVFSEGNLVLEWC